MSTPLPTDANGYQDEQEASAITLADQASNAEAHLLHVTMWGSKDTRDVILSRITPEHFGREAHRELWNAIVALDADGVTPEPDSVVLWLAERERLDWVGGATAVWKLPQAMTANAMHWCEKVEGNHLRRQVARSLSATWRDVLDPSLHPEVTRLEAISLLSDLALADRDDALWSFESLMEVTPQPFLVPGLLPQGLIVLWGAAKAGKSFVSLALGLACASGTSFYGFEATEPMPVLYLAGEGVHAHQERVQAWNAATGERPQGFTLYGGSLNLSDDAEYAYARHLIRKQSARLVFIDTWARFSGVTDENDNAQASEVVRRLDALRDELDCTFVVVHHANADGGKMRGATALLGAVDAALLAKRDDDTGRMTLSTSDSRRGVGFRPMTFMWRSSGPDFVLELEGDRPRSSDRDQRLARALQALEVAPTGYLVEALLRAEFGLDDHDLRTLRNHAQTAQRTNDQGAHELWHVRNPHNPAREAERRAGVGS